MCYLIDIFYQNSMILLFLDSSMVEHSAVNRVVAGSSPARGAENRTDMYLSGFYFMERLFREHYSLRIILKKILKILIIYYKIENTQCFYEWILYFIFKMRKEGFAWSSTLPLCPETE